MLRFDEARALRALPLMLPTEKERREAVDIVRRIGYADREITPKSRAVLERIERILGLDKPVEAKPVTKGAPTRTTRRARQVAK